MPVWTAASATRWRTGSRVVAIRTSPEAGRLARLAISSRARSTKYGARLAELFQKKELLKNYGKTYEVQLIYVANTSAQIPMLAAKEIDIAWIAYSSFATAIENAQLDIKAILDISSYGEPGHFTSYWSVMKDSPIKTIQDIKGKRIAVPAIMMP